MSRRVAKAVEGESTRRSFLKHIGEATAAGAAAAAIGNVGLAAAAGERRPGRVGRRTLGKTGLLVSEVGFGGHSWNYARVADGKGGLRRTTLEEATRMISLGLEMGVNVFDSCTPLEEHSMPGEVIKRLNKRDEIIVCARLCHKMKGVAGDRETIYRWVDERLKLWQTDRFDVLLLTNEVNDTPQSGYWDMSYSLEAVAKLKQQGKIRYAGFGCHFTPDWFREAFDRFGREFDVCSMPYNFRHRGAEELIPLARKLGLGIVTIKAFARGELLQGHDLEGAEAGLARDMLAFVLDNKLVDCCICGVHTEAHVRENFSASWAGFSPDARRRLEQLATRGPCRAIAWLENGWLGVNRPS